LKQLRCLGDNICYWYYFGAINLIGLKMTANMVGPHPLAHADYVLKPISSDLDLLSVGFFSPVNRLLGRNDSFEIRTRTLGHSL